MAAGSGSGQPHVPAHKRRTSPASILRCPTSYLDQLFTRDVDQLDGRRDPSRLRRFFEAYVRFVAGVVLHTGPRVFPIEDRIIAAPVAAFWS